MSYRQGTVTWSMQVSYDMTTGNIQVDIDPHNPNGGFFGALGHGLDVSAHFFTGNDANYHDVANSPSLNLSDHPCP